jgi:hypothetical protein
MTRETHNNGDALLRVEHVWCQSDDRWVYIEHYKSGYLGLNFMQGDEYELFKDSWCKMDRGLSEFYSGNREILKRASQQTELNLINTAMWLYHDAIANHEWHGKEVQHEFNKVK